MKTLTELYTEVNSIDEKQTPAQAMQTRRKMARRMKLLARKASVKMKKQRMLTRRRSPDALRRSKQSAFKRNVLDCVGAAFEPHDVPRTAEMQTESDAAKSALAKESSMRTAFRNALH